MAVCDSAQRKSRAPHSHPWLAEALSAFDARQRRRQAVFEYSRNPALYFPSRYQPVAPHELRLRDGTRVRPGDRVARLHFWNEQIPHAAGRRRDHRMGAPDAAGHRDLARRACPLSRRRDPISPTSPSSAATCLPATEVAERATRPHHGAITDSKRSPKPHPLPLGERLHRFGENILISLIVLAHNAAALRRDTLKRVRVPIYLSRRVLEQEFALMDERCLGA